MRAYKYFVVCFTRNVKVVCRPLKPFSRYRFILYENGRLYLVYVARYRMPRDKGKLVLFKFYINLTRRLPESKYFTKIQCKALSASFIFYFSSLVPNFNGISQTYLFMAAVENQQLTGFSSSYLPFPFPLELFLCWCTLSPNGWLFIST